VPSHRADAPAPGGLGAHRAGRPASRHARAGSRIPLPLVRPADRAPAAARPPAGNPPRKPALPGGRVEARRAERGGPPSRRERSQGHRHRAPGTAVNVPQMGIAGALGLATIAAPLSGVLPAAVPHGVQDDDLQPAALTRTLGGDGTVPAGASSTGPSGTGLAVVSRAGSAAQRSGTGASRARQRSVLPGCDGTVAVTRAANGRLPAENLCTLWDGESRLRTDAAIALARLNMAYHRRFGHDMELVDSYRTLQEQREVRASRGGYAARPGTSQHGWGVAVDLGDGVASGTGRTYDWLSRNAGAYGWENPDWARSGGSGPHEPWHWEYVPGRDGGGTSA